MRDMHEGGDAQDRANSPAEIQNLVHSSKYVYVNSSAVTASNWDVRIAFGEVLPSGATEVRVAVCMSHQHFKALVGVLSANLKKFEEQFGEIKYEAPAASPHAPQGATEG
jgi:hypothetical protein